MKVIALLAIRGYQRFISPHKGFRCAYGLHTKRCSCSGLGYRAIRRFGLIDGVAVLRMRLQLCGDLHRFHLHKRHTLSMQAGVIDCGGLDCVGCNLHSASPICDVLSCCDCSGCGGSGSSKDYKDTKKKGHLFVYSK